MKANAFSSLLSKNERRIKMDDDIWDPFEDAEQEEMDMFEN